MLAYLEKNSKDRFRARLAAIANGDKPSSLAAAEAVLDSIPASGTMSQHEVNEVQILLYIDSGPTLNKMEALLFKSC